MPVKNITRNLWNFSGNTYLKRGTRFPTVAETKYWRFGLLARLGWRFFGFLGFTCLVSRLALDQLWWARLFHFQIQVRPTNTEKMIFWTNILPKKTTENQLCVIQIYNIIEKHIWPITLHSLPNSLWYIICNEKTYTNVHNNEEIPYRIFVISYIILQLKHSCYSLLLSISKSHSTSSQWKKSFFPWQCLSVHIFVQIWFVLASCFGFRCLINFW